MYSISIHEYAKHGVGLLVGIARHPDTGAVIAYTTGMSEAGVRKQLDQQISKIGTGRQPKYSKLDYSVVRKQGEVLDFAQIPRVGNHNWVYTNSK